MTDQVTQLAFQIADEAASSEIEIRCPPAGEEPSSVEAIRACWYDLDRIKDPVDISVVKISVEYLDRRGLLKRHPAYGNWVRPRYEIYDAIEVNA